MSAQSTAQLRAAVQQQPLSNRQGIRQRLFALWFNGLVYNQIWEDPRVDLTALRLDSQSRVLCISSGGCNVLNYLVEQPASITALDLNLAHMSLTRLKLAALEHLPDHESVFQLLGVASGEQNVKNYWRYLSENLDEDTREFWEDKSWLAGKRRGARINYFSRGFYDHGRNGYFLHFFHAFARAIGRDPTRLLSARTAKEQATLYESIIAPFFDNWFVRLVVHLPITAFGLGIPPQQYQLIKSGEPAAVLGLYRDRVKRLACDFPVSENYFAWQAFGRCYDVAQRRAVPDYLLPQNYATIRDNVHRVRTVVASLTEYLRGQGPGRFNRFALLDAQDWMDHQRLSDLWHEIARTGEVGTRIIFRTAATESPIERALPHDLRRRFSYDRKLSKELHQQDRAAIYGGFHVYSLMAPSVTLS